MDWDGFVEALAEDLSNLPAGVFIVIKEPAEPRFARWVQFHQEDDELDSSLVANTSLEEPARASVEKEQRIREAGWSKREISPGVEEWYASLRWPATSQKYLQLTQMIVVALRDGYGIAAPLGWRYRAWNGRDGNSAYRLTRTELVQEN